MDDSRKLVKMINTAGGHYAIILKTKKKQDSSFLFLDEVEIDLCSFKAVRKVHEVNQHKLKSNLQKHIETQVERVRIW